MALTSKYTVNSWQSRIDSHIVCTRIWIVIAQNQPAPMNTWTPVSAKGKHHSSRRNRKLLPSSDSRKVEFEVELPGVDARRIFPLFICESQAQLDNFEQVNVAAKKLVLIIYGAAEFTDRPDNNSRELCVLQGRENWVPPWILLGVIITTLLGQSRQWKPLLFWGTINAYINKNYCQSKHTSTAAVC